MAAHPARSLVAVLAAGIALRLPFLLTPFESDEGGFLMVAKQWHGRGQALYTDQWVDRPPLLLLVFKVADDLGGSRLAVRLLALGFGIVFVVAAYWAGRVVNGARGAVSAAVVATAISAGYAFHGFALTGEAIAGAFVMTSIALLLEARYGGRLSPLWTLVFAIAAGSFAALAFLSKQNFFDAGVFAFVLLITQPYRTWRLILAYGTGVAIPVIATLLWVVSDDGPGPYRMWVALFRFRQRSLTVIEDASLAAPLERLRWLLVLIVITGLLCAIWQTLAAARRVEGRRSLRLALVAMLGYVCFSIAAGASWWTHYLLQFGAVLALGTALASTRELPTWRRHGPATVLTLTSVISCAVGIQHVMQGNLPAQHEQHVADFLREASEPGDSAVLAYGSPSIIEESGLTTPYRYAWSLPIRTRDPHLNLLVSTLRGPQAPTWLVEIGHFNWWGLDTPAFEKVRRTDYRLFAKVCGHDVYLRTGEQRPMPAITC